MIPSVTSRRKSVSKQQTQKTSENKREAGAPKSPDAESPLTERSESSLDESSSERSGHSAKGEIPAGQPFPNPGVDEHDGSNGFVFEGELTQVCHVYT